MNPATVSNSLRPADLDRGVLEPEALDAAFADLPELLSRVDGAEPGSQSQRYVDETQRLVHKIGEQMQTLQQQRDRLVHLLSELDGPRAK